MAILASQQWWVRTDGNDLNGGGYDSTISGATTNYSDQASPQLSLTDVVTIGTTTVTSVTGGFTTAMIGNILRIAGDGYYVVTARATTNSITVDRNTGTGTGQSARLGGAFAGLNVLATDPAPTLASPLIAGNIIHLRGTGSFDGTADYTPTVNVGAGHYLTFANATTDVPITVVGYNGRPCLAIFGSIVSTKYWTFDTIKTLVIGASLFNNFVYQEIGVHRNCIFDFAGFDVPGILYRAIVNCWIKNTGSTSAGSFVSVESNNTATTLVGTLFTDQRGWAAQIQSEPSSVIGCIFARCHHATNAAVVCTTTDPVSACIIQGSVFDSNASDGISFANDDTLFSYMVLNNDFTNNGGYGVKFSGSANPVADTLPVLFDYNNYFNNTSGAISGLSGGAHDKAVDPQYVNASGNDFTPQNTALKGAAVPLTLGAATNYQWIGAIQALVLVLSDLSWLPRWTLQIRNYAHTWIRVP